MIKPLKLKLYGLHDIDKIPQLQKISEKEIFESKIVSQVLPFRTNNYIIEELIDWANVPDDSMYKLNFMQRDMLPPEHFERMAKAINQSKSSLEIKLIANSIRFELNPHPAEQLTANVPHDENDEIIPGVQHKYDETCLIFPSSGQTCHAYCTFCFRWPQFVGLNNFKFATDKSQKYQKYLMKHKEITDVLITGGDPMIMSAAKLASYIKPLLSPEYDHIRNIRIGTKSISYWPYRYVTDKDAYEILKLFEKIVKAGKHLSVMNHFNHWVELSTNVAKEAVRLIRSTGAEIRAQSPVIHHINDDYKIWVKMWKAQVREGIIPYYFFIARNTGAVDYFKIPLVKAFEIFRNAYTHVSGLCRTVRGPVMSSTSGKIVIEGISKIKGEKVFVLNFLQSRNSNWTKRTFFAQFDSKATWIDELKPAFGENKFFFEDELEGILKGEVASINTVEFIKDSLSESLTNNNVA